LPRKVAVPADEKGTVLPGTTTIPSGKPLFPDDPERLDLRVGIETPKVKTSERARSDPTMNFGRKKQNMKNLLVRGVEKPTPRRADHAAGEGISPRLSWQGHLESQRPEFQDGGPGHLRRLVRRRLGFATTSGRSV